MAKKKKPNTASKEVQQEKKEEVLPQNILPVGERVEENKRIYISQRVYREIHKFTKNKTTDESGGVLMGKVVEAFGKTNILISGFIEAKYCDATPTTLKFTHETWKHIHKEAEKKFPHEKIMGWIHTHPNFGIFLSEYDKFIHENFFSEPNQIAYVVDPIQNIEGFYFWIDGKLERCKGFYLYDKTGVQIDAIRPQEEEEEEEERSLLGMFTLRDVALLAMALAVAIVLFSNFSLKAEINELRSRQEELQTQQQMLVDSANLSLMSMSYHIADLENLMEDLQDQIHELHAPEEAPEAPEAPEDAETGDDITENTEEPGTNGEESEGEPQDE